MRIAQLVGWYSPTSGGIRTVVDRLGRGYRELGHESILVVPAARDAAVDGLISLRAPRLPASGGYRWLLQRSRLTTTLTEIQPDVIEIHDKFWLAAVGSWAAPRGVPVVAYSHERLDVTVPLLLPVPQLVADRVAHHYRQTMYRWADVVVTCSAFAAQEYSASNRVPLGVDTKTFRPTRTARDAGSPGVIELLLVSRLSREKRPDVAVDALAELRRRGRDVRLTVLGDGPLRRSLQRRAADLPVRFAGFVAGREAVAAAMAAADVAFAPGPAETFGLSALEAMACGVSVVAATGAAVAELVASGGGRSAQPSGTAFADAVETLVDVPERHRRQAARAAALAHPWERTIAAALDVLTSAVGTATRGCPRATVPAWQVTAQARSMSARTVARS